MPIPKSTVLAKRTKADRGAQQPLRKADLAVPNDGALETVVGQIIPEIGELGTVQHVFLENREIAFRKGFIDRDQPETLPEALCKNEYGEYLFRVGEDC